MNTEYINYAAEFLEPWFQYQRFIRRVPSISVGLIHENEIVWTQAFGYADLRAKKKANRKTRYRIASISKLFTATALMQLVEQGKLRIEDPVQKHVDWFKNRIEDLSKITVIDILHHYSGLTRDGGTPHWSDSKFPTVEQLKIEVEHGVRIFPPGRRFKYSNFGYSIVGEVVKSASGMEYSKYVEQNIFRPLRLRDTFVDLDEDSKRNLAKGYGKYLLVEERRIEFKDACTFAMAPATGFVSTAPDLCKFISAHFEGNNALINDFSKRKMQKLFWKDEERSEGYGIGHLAWLVQNEKLVGHSGRFIGFITRVNIDAKNKVGLVILTNSIDGPTHPLTDGTIHTLRYFRKHWREFSEKNRMKSYQNLVGRFRNRWGTLQISRIGGALVGFDLEEERPMDSLERFQPTAGENEFKISQADGFDSVGERARFEVGRNGKASKLFIGPNSFDLDIVRIT